ncbi:MAG TPA: DNA double-strand break repair nuclease NurA [Chloroflexota bacterium]|nr:DNA double-strand break repair nuclease NurA [Chloroflexota bacterium]
MLYAARVSQQLEASAERFRAFADSEAVAFRRFDQALSQLDRLDHDELLALLADAQHPGALPGDEWVDRPGLLLPFATRFAHHRSAREWALEHITGVATVAVDGSEIKPTKDYSLPIAAVQVAWFENPHQENGRYVKDAAFELIHPDELTGEPGDGFGTADQKLALRRFQAEVRTLIERMEALAARGWHDHPPVAFFDGSLVVSFTAGMFEDFGTRYIEAICHLLRASEQAGIPVVGYVDTSLAKDVTTMLAVLGDLPRPQRVPDSRLLDARMSWGDRTRALICAREGVLERYRIEGGLTPPSRAPLATGDGEGSPDSPSPFPMERGRRDEATPGGGVRQVPADYSQEICFVYLKTNGLAPPARLDLPRWVVREGLLDYVVDVVRAEVIVGNGYPYCIETADACAVLSVRDRERFYRLLQEFATRQGIGLRIVPKAASKRRRRV